MQQNYLNTKNTNYVNVPCSLIKIGNACLISQNSTYCITTCHLAHELRHRKLTCCVMLVGQHVATSSTRRTHVQECCHRVDWGGQLDMSTSLFPEVVPETDANPEHKILIFNCKHNITASSSSATLEQAEWNTFVTMCVS